MRRTGEERNDQIGRMKFHRAEIEQLQIIYLYMYKICTHTHTHMLPYLSLFQNTFKAVYNEEIGAEGK